MTIDEQLREMTRRADQLQSAITAEEVILRASRRHGADRGLAGPRTLRRRSLWLAIAAVMALFTFLGSMARPDGDQSIETNSATEPTATAAPPIWLGPELDRGTVTRLMADRPLEDSPVHEYTWQDSLDAAVAYVDLTGVRAFEPHPGGMNGYWTLEMAAVPPPFIDLEPGIIVSYGIAFDTNADGVADFTAGIDNDAPARGDFRAWVTNLATGETKKQVGEPYGFPIEFSYGSGSDCTVSSEEPRCQVDLMFLSHGDSPPEGLDPKTARFFVWATVTRDGVLVANDYVPDNGWLASE